MIVDSSVWIDALRGVASPQVACLNRSLTKQPVGLTTLIYCEVLQGIRQPEQFRETRIELQRFPIFRECSAELSIQSAIHYRILRSRGITIRRTIDCLIATFCIQNDFQLLHHDSDFDIFQQHLGLQVPESASAL